MLLTEFALAKQTTLYANSKSGMGAMLRMGVWIASGSSCFQAVKMARTSSIKVTKSLFIMFCPAESSSSRMDSWKSLDTDIVRSIAERVVLYRW